MARFMKKMLGRRGAHCNVCPDPHSLHGDGTGSYLIHREFPEEHAVAQLVAYLLRAERIDVDICHERL